MLIRWGWNWVVGLVVSTWDGRVELDGDRCVLGWGMSVLKV